MEQIDLNEIIEISWVTMYSIGVKVLIFMILFYMLLVVFDYIVGTLSARVHKLVSSKSNTMWTLLKACIIGFILIIAIFVAGVTNLFKLSEEIFIMLSFIPSIFMGLFTLWEITSIIEKLSVLFANKKSWMIFNLLNYLSQKIFDLTLDKLKEKVDERIEDRANRI